MAMNLQHQTAAEFAARFWREVRKAKMAGDQIRFCRLLYWLERRLVAGDITDAGARVSFNTAFGRSLSAAEWAALRSTRIKPTHDRYAGILSEGDL